MAPSTEFLVTRLPAVLVLAGLTLAACAPTQSMQQVRATDPSVTFEFRGDAELLEAQAKAVTYCQRFQAVPGPATIGPGRASGTSSVSFDCAASPTPEALERGAALGDLSFDYRTDQQLLDATRTAQA